MNSNESVKSGKQNTGDFSPGTGLSSPGLEAFASRWACGNTQVEGVFNEMPNESESVKSGKHTTGKTLSGTGPNSSGLENFISRGACGSTQAGGFFSEMPRKGSKFDALESIIRCNNNCKILAEKTGSQKYLKSLRTLPKVNFRIKNRKIAKPLYISSKLVYNKDPYLVLYNLLSQSKRRALRRSFESGLPTELRWKGLEFSFSQNNNEDMTTDVLKQIKQLALSYLGNKYAGKITSIVAAIVSIITSIVGLVKSNTKILHGIALASSVVTLLVNLFDVPDNLVNQVGSYLEEHSESFVDSVTQEEGKPQNGSFGNPNIQALIEANLKAEFLIAVADLSVFDRTVYFREWELRNGPLEVDSSYVQIDDLFPEIKDAVNKDPSLLKSTCILSDYDRVLFTDSSERIVFPAPYKTEYCGFRNMCWYIALGLPLKDVEESIRDTIQKYRARNIPFHRPDFIGITPEELIDLAAEEELNLKLVSCSSESTNLPRPYHWKLNLPDSTTEYFENDPAFPWKTVYYCTSGPVGSHYFGSMISDPPSINEALFECNLPDMFKKIMAWVVTIGLGYGLHKALGLFDLTSLFDRMSKTLTSLPKTVSSLDTMQNWLAENVFGMITPTVRMNDDNLSRTKELNAYLELPTFSYFINPVKIGLFEKAINEAEHSMKVQKEEAKNTRQLLLGAITAARQRLQEIKQKYFKLADRQLPVGIYFHGKEGVGKSELIKQLCQDLMKNHNWSTGSVYHIQDDKYMPQYRQEPIYWRDEMYKLKNFQEDYSVKNRTLLLSETPCYIQSAFSKDDPAAHVYHFESGNPRPEDVFHGLPYMQAGINAYMGRGVYIHCEYNVPGQEQIHRDKKIRLENFAHLTMTMGEWDPIMEQVKPVLHNVSYSQLLDYCLAKEKEHASKYQSRLHKNTNQAASNNHCVIQLQGVAGSFKSTSLENLVEKLSATYCMPVKRAKCGERFNKFELVSPSVITVEDQLLLDVDGRLPPQTEQWYMDLYNDAPNGCIIIITTNIALEKRKKFILSRALLKSVTNEPLYTTYRKSIFRNEGMVRRMGYFGNIKLRNEIVFQNGHEFELASGNFSYRGAPPRSICEIEPILYNIVGDYRKAFGEFKIQHVGNLPPCTPDIRITGNKTIVNDLLSIPSILKMMTGVTKNGNSIAVSEHLLEATTKIDPCSLVPKHKLEYNQASLLSMAQFFFNALSPIVPSVKILVRLNDLPDILIKDRCCFVASATTVDPPSITRIAFPNITMEFAEEWWEIDIFQFSDLDGTPSFFDKFSHYPREVIEFVRNYLANPGNTAAASALLKHKMAREYQKCRVVLSQVVAKIIAWFKATPAVNIVILFSLGISSLGVLLSIWKMFSTSKPRDDPKKEAVELLVQLEYMKSLKELGIKQDTKSVVDAFLALPEEVRIKALAKFQTLNEAKGKSKQGRGLSKQRFSKSAKAFKVGRKVVYTDEDGNIEAEYDTLGEYVTYINKGNKIHDFYKENMVDVTETYVYGEPYENEALSPDPSLVPHSSMSLRPDYFGSFSNNLVYVSTVGLEGQNGELTTLHARLPALYGIGIRDRFLIVPRHVCVETLKVGNSARLWIADSRAFKNNIPIFYSAEVVLSNPKYDYVIAEVRDPSFPSFKNIMDKFVSEDKIGDTMFGAFYLPTSVQGRVVDNFYTVDMYPEWKDTISFDISKNVHSYATCNFYSNSSVTTPGCCGLPYFIQRSDGRADKILGFHIGKVSGFAGNQGICQIITKGYLEKELQILDSARSKINQNQAASIKLSTDYATKSLLSKVKSQDKNLCNLPQRDYKWMEVLGPIKPVPTSKSSAYMPTKISSIIEISNDKRPFESNPANLPKEMLEKLQVDRNGIPSALVTQELLWDDDISPEFPIEEQELIVEELFPEFLPMMEEFEVLDPETSLNDYKNLEPMILDTSPGYIFNTQFGVKEKSELIDLNHQTGRRSFHSRTEGARFLTNCVSADFKNASEGRMPIWIYKNCLKDEKLPNEKYFKGRIFTIADTRQVIFERRVLGTVYAAFAKRECFCAVGSTTEICFNKWADEFIARGRMGFAGDYSRWDKRAHPLAFEILIKCFLKALHAVKASVSTQEENLIRIAIRCLYYSFHASGSTLYRKFKGLDSGGYGTAVVNSCINLVKLYSTWRRIMISNNKPHSYSVFKELYFFRMYGDDLIVAVPPPDVEIFNLEILAREQYQMWGCVLDTADKDGNMYKVKDFLNLSFISRTFTAVPIPGGRPYYFGRLKKESISGLVHWQRVNSGLEQLGVQLEIALYESAFYPGESLFRQVVDAAIKYRKLYANASILVMPKEYYHRIAYFTSLGVETEFDPIKQWVNFDSCVNQTNSNFLDCVSFIYRLQQNRVIEDLHFDFNGKIAQLSFNLNGEKFNFLQEAPNKKVGKYILASKALQHFNEMKVVKGDLLGALEDTIIVHSIGRDCTMGAGVALQIRQTFPGIKDEVRTRIQVDNLTVGSYVLTEQPRKIIHLITKHRSSRPYRDSLVHFVVALKKVARDFPEAKFAIPKLECGLNGHSWTIVRELVEKILGDRVVLFQYQHPNALNEGGATLFATLFGCVPNTIKEQNWPDPSKLCEFRVAIKNVLPKNFEEKGTVFDFEEDRVLVYSASIDCGVNAPDDIFTLKSQFQKLKVEGFNLKKIRLISDGDKFFRVQVMYHANSNEMESSQQAPVASSVSSTSSAENVPQPNPIQTLPSQVASAPSINKAGAGEIASSATPFSDMVEFNVEAAPVDMPQLSGRGFTLEEYLWNQLIMSEEGVISSNTNTGTIITRLSASPLGLTTLHNQYALLHKSASFHNEAMFMMVGAMNVAGVLLIGWVQDISKTTYTIQEVMSTSYKFIDVNGTKTIRLSVGDARQDKFYRKLNDTLDTNPIPGIVVMLFSPLNNMYGTAETYSVAWKKLVRFGQRCYFFDPLTPAELQSGINTIGVQRPLSITAQYPLDLFASESPNMFIGGGTKPTCPTIDAAGYIPVEALSSSPRLVLRVNAVFADKYGWVGGITPRVLSDSNATSSHTIYINGSFFQLRHLILRDIQTDGVPRITDASYPEGDNQIATFYSRKFIVDGCLTDCIVAAPAGYTINTEPEYAKFPQTISPALDPGYVKQTLISSGADGYAGFPVKYPYHLAANSNENISVLYGNYTGDTDILGSGLKHFDFIGNNQYMTNSAVTNVFPFSSKFSFNLQKFLVKQCRLLNTTRVSFNINSPSGVILRAAFSLLQGFVVNSNVENVISTSLSLSQYYLTGITAIGSLDSLVATDTTFYSPFLNTASALALKQQQFLKSKNTNEAAFFAANAASGLFSGIANWAASRQEFADKKWLQGAALQNELDKTKLQGANQLALAKQQAQNTMQRLGVTSSGVANSTQTHMAPTISKIGAIYPETNEKALGDDYAGLSTAHQWSNAQPNYAKSVLGATVDSTSA